MATLSLSLSPTRLRERLSLSLSLTLQKSRWSESFFLEKAGQGEGKVETFNFFLLESLSTKKQSFTFLWRKICRNFGFGPDGTRSLDLGFHFHTFFESKTCPIFYLLECYLELPGWLADWLLPCWSQFYCFWSERKRRFQRFPSTQFYFHTRTICLNSSKFAIPMLFGRWLK